MKYAIIRMQKLKSVVAVRRSLKHAFREQETPNADTKLAAENTHLGASSSAEAIKKFNAALPDKVRSNAVLCVEFLVTASPEKMKEMTNEQQKAYFNDALRFIREKHGSENVFYAGIHRDESTPHMYAYVTPKVDGKLNCRAFYGEKDALTRLQSDFSTKVGEKHGLTRGIEGSKAKHTRIKQFYTDLNKTADLPKLEHPNNVPLPATKLLESKEDYARRAVRVYSDAVLNDFGKNRRLAGLNATNTQKALESEKTAEEAQRRERDAIKRYVEAEKTSKEYILALKKLLLLPEDQILKHAKEAKQAYSESKKQEEERAKSLQTQEKLKPKGPRL